MSVAHLSVATSQESSDDADPKITIKDRRTQELVIALVGPVAAGVTTTAKIIKKLFEDRYGYSINSVRVSELITESAPLVSVRIPPNQGRAEHIRLYQDIGTALRERFGDAYLAEKCIERIAFDRKNSGGYAEVGGGTFVAVPRRRVHIIDSLKNPGELSKLREVYGDTLWVFGILAPQSVRQKRLKDENLQAVEALSIIKIDEEEGVDHGQRVTETIHHADFFVRNDQDNDVRLQQVISRYLELIFGTDVHTPTQDEGAMYEAASESSRSACLSRQVGAVIYSVDGELIGQGDNDVPKFKGGLYTEDDGNKDHRCHKWLGKICHNDQHKRRLYESIHAELKSAGLLAKKVSVDQVVAAVKKTDAKNLIEYSRAVHAEMEAIVSVARGHKAGIVGGTMYTTTYPCHNCARHIVASGITKVIYIEPYTKSKAIDLHSDSISDTETPGEDKVSFLQFEGVAPKNIIKLFRLRADHPRKTKTGSLRNVPAGTADPVFAADLDGFDRREQIIVTELARAEEEARANAKSGPTTVRTEGRDDGTPARLPLLESGPDAPGPGAA